MGYYMRYFSTDDKDIKVDELDKALKSIDKANSIDGQTLEIKWRDVTLAVMEINSPGEEAFEEELKEFLEMLSEARGKTAQVGKVMKSTKKIVALQILFGGRETEETLEKLDPLLEWLLANRTGLLQADGEGFYSQKGLIAELE